MKRKGYVISILFVCMLWMLIPGTMRNVMAADAYTVQEDKTEDESDDWIDEEEFLDQYEFDEINESLRELFPEEKLDFKETVLSIISGDTEFTAQLLNRLVGEQLGYAFSSCRSNLLHILLLAIMAAVFTNFSNIFQNRQISEVSFYILYLLLIALCLNSFQSIMEWVSDGISNLTDFMGVFCPIYFLAVAAAKGSSTAVAFYNLVLFLIYFVESFIVNFLLPVIHIYIMVKVLNFLSPEEYLSKFAELIETAINWLLKTLLACIIGLNVVQGLISPAIDAVKRSAVTRSAEAIPGIGDALGGMTEVVLGTAVLIKNGIGLAGAIVCFAICIIPLVQMGLIVLMYKLAAAVVQPISDKRVIGCIESVGDGCRMMMRVVFTTGMLFLITIVIVSALTMNG